jgi:hypothetical protein
MENDRERGGSPVLLPSSLSAALGWAHSRSWSSSGNSNRLQQRVHASLNGNGNRRAHLTGIMKFHWYYEKKLYYEKFSIAF